MERMYREYFAIDEDYFPQVNESSIAAASSEFWMKTYPHETFVQLLKNMERVLARQEKRSLWIEGSYGTGKSQCAYALKKILEVPEQELREYWNTYDTLKKESDLLEKLLGHKEKGIVTAHRYASGNINSPRDLFIAIQDSVKNALTKEKMYVGENTLKDSVIAWIEDPTRKNFFNDLLKKPEWATVFSQDTADEVLESLRSNGELTELMSNIFCLADKEGITALNIDADRLIAWLNDVIDKNNVKIVLIWDEFSSYFKKNRESLDEFQKVAELVNSKPFYLIVVTHESGQLFSSSDKTWKIVSDRFIPTSIALPDNIAFNLISHAFNVKDVAGDEWNEFAEELNARINASRRAVMNAAKISDENTMTRIMPMHPMAALVLKNIASSFKSNQRSIFDFIKSAPNDNVKAFQWFIDNYGPLDDAPLLTVDMLWDFFYEKGKENLTPDIRHILDTFNQQTGLRHEEEIVLKAILIMQALDKRMGGQIDLFKTTELNLSYIFEGISDLQDSACIHIAKELVRKGILVTSRVSDNKNAFVVAVLAGDQDKIEKHKKDIIQNSNAARLALEGELSTAIPLSPALRLRFETETATSKLQIVTNADFSRNINALSEKNVGWKFQAVVALCLNDKEIFDFRNKIKSAASDERYKNIIFIDALGTPLGDEAFEQYVEYSAMAMYYGSTNHATAKDNASKAKSILSTDWRNRIYNGQFVLYDYTNPHGEKFSNSQSLINYLQTVVIKKFPLIFDFEKGLTETQLKLTQAKPSAMCGIKQEARGVVGGIEKHALCEVWHKDTYWQNPDTKNLKISKLKNTIEQSIESSFAKDGQISIGHIYDILEKDYGFAPSNLSAFLTGFLLKEYAHEPYRYGDSSGGHEPMSPEKLSEMIGNYIGKNPKPTYILKRTREEMAFYDVTEKGWGLTKNSCISVNQAALAIERKIRHLALPIWTLSEVATGSTYDIVQKYIELMQSEGSVQHKKAIEIGNIALHRTQLENEIFELLTPENCQKGMREFLEHFENGKVKVLAEEIGAQDIILKDIRALFQVEHSCLWNQQTNEDELRKLLVDYGIVKETNFLLTVKVNSLAHSFKEWREKIRFLNISWEALNAEYPQLSHVLKILLKITQHGDILFEQRKEFLSDIKIYRNELREILENDLAIFTKIYAPYLTGLTVADITKIKPQISADIFAVSKIESNSKVKEAVEIFQKKQLRSKLMSLWQDKTGTKNPREWSEQYQTPILCCVPEEVFTDAKQAFEALNRIGATDAEMQKAINFLEQTEIFETLSSEEKRNASFTKTIMNEYSCLLPNILKVKSVLKELSSDIYGWFGNPAINAKIKQLAEAEYNAGGSNKALSKIDEMDDEQLKVYLKRLIRENMAVGIEIITDRGSLK